MKPPVDTVRIGKKGRDILLKLKRNTGIENWNILCRWALCASLREVKCPSLSKANADGGVEMSWKVFAGDYSEVFTALIINRAARDGYDKSPEDRAEYLRAHIARGLEYLGSGYETKSIGAFLVRWGLEGSKLSPEN
jgi:DNA sulfur modification protein DndE